MHNLFSDGIFIVVQKIRGSSDDSGFGVVQGGMVLWDAAVDFGTAQAFHICFSGGTIESSELPNPGRTARQASDFGAP